MSALTFFVNGKKIEVRSPEPLTSLLSYLRRELLLTGTKLVCGEGGCGACTILISRYDHHTKALRHFSANACLLPLAWVHGCAITTIEGLGSTKNKLHPLQRSLADHHGSQCGMCSPGMVMSIQGLVCGQEEPPTVTDIEDTLAGNLCRCTGYRSIFEAFEPLSKGECDFTTPGDLLSLLPPISVEDLKDLSTRSAVLRDENTTWYHPISLTELLEMRTKYPKAPLSLGFTSLFWSNVNQVGCKTPVVVSGTDVPELSHIEMTETGLVIGAATTITRLVAFIEKKGRAGSDHRYAGHLEMARMLKSGFGSAQLRNIATIGGSIASGGGSSDVITAFVALGGSFTVQSQTGKRVVQMDQSFLSCRSIDLLNEGEVIVSAEIPYTNKDEVVKVNKHVLRKGTKTLTTLAARLTLLEAGGKKTISSVSLALGGFGKQVRLLKHTADVIKSKAPETVQMKKCIRDSLMKDLIDTCNTDGEEEKYKASVTVNVLCKILDGLFVLDEGVVKNAPLTSEQRFLPAPDDQSESDHVGRPLVHQAAYQQCTGEALYLDDIPSRKDELFLVFVKSTQAHAKLLSVDPSEALSLPGVVDFISASNIPATMKGIFASEKVEYHSHPIGAVLAASRETARRAASLVKVEYELLEPLLTMEKAIEIGSYHGEKVFTRGDVEKALLESPVVVTGTVRLGSQEHWYLETHCCLAVPGECGEMEVTISTQHQSLVQQAVCKAVGLDSNRVVLRSKRLGGGFGGKDTTRGALLAVPTVYAANRHGVPVRCVLERDEDIRLTGQRCPYLAHYKLGVQKDGMINVLDLEYYIDGGWKEASSIGLIRKGMMNLDNCYKFPVARLVGRACKTNKSSKPPFRGFGGPECHYLIESALDKCAKELNMDPAQLRRKNMLSVGDLTIMNTKLEDCTASKCWEEVLVRSSLEDRKRAVLEFNSCHTSRKRGLYVVPTKLSGSFPVEKTMGGAKNRGSALVNAYQDGSVLVSHCGVEMGQGLHTKMIQIASRVLDIAPSQIHIAETRTDMLANAHVSAASACTDLNGPAVKDACEKMIELLKPYSDVNPQGKWIDWVNAAVADRVSLTTVGTFRIEKEVSWNWEDGGQTFPYFTFGAGVSEVEIDCLTGKYQILRTDIVMDVGKSLNPAIDIGQIEGAFLQNAGVLTTEKFDYNQEGAISSTSLGNYILPGIENIPREFNVSLLRDAPNPWPQAVYSSKAIGEPPMTLALSVFFAIREAIQARREEMGLGAEFTLDAPATPQRVLACCTDQ